MYLFAPKAFLIESTQARLLQNMALPIDKIRHFLGSTILGLLPIAALFGNYPADIMLVLTLIVSLRASKDIFHTLTQSRFIQLLALALDFVVFRSFTFFQKTH